MVLIVDTELSNKQVDNLMNEATVQQEQVTQFVDSTQDTVAVAPSITPNVDYNPFGHETLYSFLSRPYPIATIEWSPTDTVDTTLAAPYAFSSIVPVLRDKLANFQYMRAGVRFTLRINGTRFHYGRLIMFWQPLVGFNNRGINTGALVDNQGFGITTGNLVSRSTYQCVLVSPNANNVVNLDLPFHYPVNWFDLANLDNTDLDLGRLNVSVFNPLSAVQNLSPVRGTLYMQLVDIELAGQTGSDLFLFESKHHKKSKGKRSKHKKHKHVGAHTEADHTEPIVKSTQGVVSGVAEHLSEATELVSTVFNPGGFVSGAAKIMSGVGHVASLFGLSNPNDVSLNEPRILRMSNIQHTHGVNSAVNLGLLQDSQVARAAEYCGGRDEDMSLLALAQRFSLLAALETNGDTPFEYSFAVCPSAHLAQAQTNTVRHFNTWLSFISAVGRLWRGSLRYVVEIVASGFHSGRLMFAFVPHKYDTASLTLDFLYSCWNKTIDIQDESTTSFVIPFLNDALWLQTDPYDVIDNGAGQIVGNVNNSTGTLVLYWVNPLSYAQSGTVPDIYINVFVSAGADFQLSVPGDTLYNGTTSSDPAVPLVTNTKDEFEFQMLFADVECPPLSGEAVGFNDSALCVSDEILSLHDVLKRPSYTSGANPTILYQLGPLGTRYLDTELVLDPDITTSVYDRNSIRNYLKIAFIGERGGVTYRLFKSASSLANNADNALFITNNYASRNASIPGPTGQNLTRGAVYFNTSYNPVVDVSVPYFNVHNFSITFRIGSPSQLEVANTRGIVPQLTNATATVYQYIIFTSVNDDYELINAYGVPTITVPNSA